MKSFTQYLEEKVIQIGKGKKEGQVIFLAGGAGSGKGFAKSNFIDDRKFKALDVDEFKRLYIKLKKYPEVANMNLRNPDDVFKLHTFVKSKGVKNAAFQAMYRSAREGVAQPNIIFDVTMKDMDDLTDVVPHLLQAGYKKENIHIVWVLADYKVAVMRNKKRSRVVPDDILLKTHEGAAKSMTDMVIKGKYPSNMINGDVHVILNNQENTIVFDAFDRLIKKAEKMGHKISRKQGVGSPTITIDGEELPEKEGKKKIADILGINVSDVQDEQNLTIKDFTYLTIKKTGKPLDKGAWQDELYKWIRSNVPKSATTKHLWND